MGPNEKFNVQNIPSANNLREVLLHHYFSLFDKLRPQKKENITERKTSSNVLCLQSQLQKGNIKHPAILAYLPPSTVLTVETILSKAVRHSSPRRFIKP